MPRFTGSLDLRGLNSLSGKQGLSVNQYNLYPALPFTGLLELPCLIPFPQEAWKIWVLLK